MSGAPPRPKPWERTGTSSLQNDGAPKPWEHPQSGTVTATLTPTTGNLATRTQPARPWERDGTTSNALATTSYGLNRSGSIGPTNYGASGTYGLTNYGSSGAYGLTNYGGGTGYGGIGNYNNSFGSYGGYGSPWQRSSYGSQYGGYNNNYSLGALGRPAYGAMYGGNMYGAPANMYGAPPGMHGPEAGGMPPQPPSAWQAMLTNMQGVVQFFGRLSFLVDENTHAVHFFISALLQLLDRFGSLYGELARFILRLLGYRGRKRKGATEPDSQVGSKSNELVPSPPPANFDSVWSNGQQG